MSLDINIKEKEPNVFIVEPIGEINTETYLRLEDKINPILKGSIQAIIFELKNVSYVSSMGLSVIFKTKLALEKKGGTVLLVNPQPKVKLVLDTVKVLPDQMFASLEEADEYLDEFLDGVQKGKITPHEPKS